MAGGADRGTSGGPDTGRVAGRSPALREALAAWLGVDIGDATRLSGGASRETWQVALDGGPASGLPACVVVQRRRPGIPALAVSTEAAIIGLADGCGVPVPEVVRTTDDPAVLGGPTLVTACVPGEAVATRVLRHEEHADARHALVGHAAEALAAISRIDPGAARQAGLGEPDPLDLLAGLHHGTGQHRPVFEVALRWLAMNHPGPPPEGVRVVHGDFRVGNLLVDHTGLSAVLDWELAHLGDPAEDLAWGCVKAWRFGSAQPALGLTDTDTWADAVAEAGGPACDRDRFRWWLVYGTLRWGVICELQVAAFTSGLVDSVELAVLGRRVVETEHDLLDLLGLGVGAPRTEPSPTSEPPPPGTPGPDAGTSTADTPWDVPGVGELVGVVERWLEGTVVDATDGQVRFHARVAANALRIVRRQLSAGDGPAADHARRLVTLGVSSNAGLAAEVRAGTWDNRLDEVGEVLAGTVTDRLAVANPGYLETPPANPWPTQ